MRNVFLYSELQNAELYNRKNKMIDWAAYQFPDETSFVE